MGSNPTLSASWNFASEKTLPRGGCAAARLGFERAFLAKRKRIYQTKYGSSRFVFRFFGSLESLFGNSFCPPAPSEQRSARRGQNSVRAIFKIHRQVSHSAKLKDVASAQSASAWYFSAILKAGMKSKNKVRSAMRKFAVRSTGKMKFCKPIFFLSLSAKG